MSRSDLGRRLGYIGVLAVAAGLATGAGAAPTTQTLIRPGKGIGKVDLGMSLAQVKRALGRPQIVNKRERLGFGFEYVEYAWNYTDWIVALSGPRGRLRVVKVATNLRRERTASGLGVGSTQAQLRRKARVKCGVAHDARLRVRAYGRTCVIGRTNGRQVVSARVVFALSWVCTAKPGTSVNCPAGKGFYRVFEVVVATPELVRQLRFDHPPT